jgi:hypothetical protein
MLVALLEGSFKVKTRSKSSPSRKRRATKTRTRHTKKRTQTTKASPAEEHSPTTPTIPESHHIDQRAAALLLTAPTTENDADLLTEQQMAAWLGCSMQWLAIGRSRGYGPPFLRLGPKMIRYHRGDGKKWLETRSHRHTAEYRNRAGAVEAR